jgi:dihydrofolate reductase
VGKVTAIVHCDQDGLIGIDGKLAYRSKEDLQFFKEYTTNSAYPTLLVMGRKTFEECGPLPGRRILVLASAGNYFCNGTRSGLSVEDLAGSQYNIVLCGGSQVYNKYLYLCSEVVLNFTTQEPKEPGVNPAYIDLRNLDSLFKYSSHSHYETFTQMIYSKKFNLEYKFSSVNWLNGTVTRIPLHREASGHWYNPNFEAENGSDEYFDDSEIHDTLIEAKAAVRTKLSRRFSRLEREKYAVLTAFENLNRNNGKSDILY